MSETFSGTVTIVDSQGRQVFHFDSSHALLDIGATGAEGDLRIWDAVGEPKIHLDGDMGCIKLLGAHCAEDFNVSEVETAEPGTVMRIDDEGALKPCDHPYDHRVAGVVSGGEGYGPGIILDKQESEVDRITVASLGRAYCKVDAGGAPIGVGDLLTTSGTVGHAMKVTDWSQALGSVLGKALRSLDQGQQGMIPILVSLQ